MAAGAGATPPARARGARRRRSLCYPLGRGQFCNALAPQLLEGDLDGRGRRLLEVLVGRAVIPCRQRLTLARSSLAGVRAALPWNPVKAGALGQPGEELLRELDVELDRTPNGELV